MTSMNFPIASSSKVATAPSLEEEQSSSASPATWRRWVAVGAGIGIECNGDDLLVTAVSVRFGKLTSIQELRIPSIAQRPASDWGSEYADFLKRLELGHLAANLVLPRDAATVRVLPLPPLSPKEIEAAVGFQIDSLHPYADDPVVHAWARLNPAGAVLVAIAREETARFWADLFAEAGISLTSMTVGPACIYSAFRLWSLPPAPQFVAVEECESEVEYYGESPSRALLSHVVPAMPAGSQQPERTQVFLRSELRLDPEAPCLRLRDLLPQPPALSTQPGSLWGGPPGPRATPWSRIFRRLQRLRPAARSLELTSATAADAALNTLDAPPLSTAANEPPIQELAGSVLQFPLSIRCYCAALSAACPWFAVSINLLPAGMRKSNSRLIFVPTVILAVLLLASGVAFLAQNAWEARRYTRELNVEIARVSPAARKAAALDLQIADALSRTRQIDSFLARSKADLDALDELTRILPPPLFASSMTLSRDAVTLEGQAESAAGLLKIMDSSPLFYGSSFAGGIGHASNTDVFHIVTKRRVVIP
jgi:hypothetical protein